MQATTNNGSHNAFQGKLHYLRWLNIPLQLQQPVMSSIGSNVCDHSQEQRHFVITRSSAAALLVLIDEAVT